VTAGAGSVEIPAADLAAVAARLFLAAGIQASDAAVVAQDLVAADLEGVASHGVMLAPMYVARIRAGSVSRESRGVIVSDRGGAVVIDARNVLGQLTARQAAGLAIDRARRHGLAAASLRDAFHFGAAGLYARLMAEAGCIGVVMTNTRPLMPAPGGAEPITGNNPIAIAAPGDGGFAPEVDMATSAAAMGKIRNAAAAGEPIPPGWATDRDGVPTQDAKAAIAGMLTPAAGPKGFGLGFMIDLLCGGLSGGAIGAGVQGLYGDPAIPYGCSSLFLAIDVAHFADLETFKARAGAEVARVGAARRAPGVERVYAPGEYAFATRSRAEGRCRIGAPVLRSLIAAAGELGVAIGDLLPEKAA
jgi:LDH2 family malate/lactate/ureidoglycolate dehydrogenase